MGGRHLKHVRLWRSCVFRRVPQVKRAAESENAELSAQQIPASSATCVLTAGRLPKPEAQRLPARSNRVRGEEDEERAEEKNQSADRFICRAGRQQALVKGREGQVGHMI